MASYPIDAGMQNRNPDVNSEATTKNDVEIFTFEGGYERRRQVSRRRQRTFTLRYNRIPQELFDGIQNFYNDRGGEFESFSFDLSHIERTGSVNVRFSGELNHTFFNKIGDTNIYDISFTLIEVFT